MPGSGYCGFGSSCVVAWVVGRTFVVLSASSLVAHLDFVEVGVGVGVGIGVVGVVVGT